jgi:hypothetical protein
VYAKERTAVFRQIGDEASEHDMDFDWADETIHATYGNRWLKTLHEANPKRVPPPEEVRIHCEPRKLSGPSPTSLTPASFSSCLYRWRFFSLTSDG